MVVSLVLLLWSLLYAFPHLYWGLGGTAGLSSLRPSATDASHFRAANVVAFVFIGATGFLGLALLRFRSARLPFLILLGICGAGAAVAFSHGSYGIIYRVEQVTGLREVDGVAFSRPEHDWVLWDLFVIEPWFAAEGVLLWLAGYFALATATARKRWIIVTAPLTLLVFLTAVLDLKAG
jgi:hypothetical protein